jgi:hypothetical protein
MSTPKRLLLHAPPTTRSIRTLRPGGRLCAEAGASRRRPLWRRTGPMTSRCTDRAPFPPPASCGMATDTIISSRRAVSPAQIAQSRAENPPRQGGGEPIYLKDLAEKTRRGLRGRIEAGKSGGGRPAGQLRREPILRNGSLRHFVSVVRRSSFSRSSMASMRSSLRSRWTS